MNVMTRRDRQK